MTAKEAKEKTENIISLSNEGEISNIARQIEVAISSGEFSIILYKSVNDKVLQHFKDLGYTYKSFSDRDGSSQTEIKW